MSGPESCTCPAGTRVHQHGCPASYRPPINAQAIMTLAVAAAGNAPYWNQKPAEVTMTLATGESFTWRDISLTGVAALLKEFGAP